MKWILVLLISLTGCSTKKDPDSYFLIDQISVVPTRITDGRLSRRYLYQNEFVRNTDTLQFIFSVSKLSFVDENGKALEFEVPSSGNLGTFELLKRIEVSLVNQKYVNGKDVSSLLIFDTLQSKIRQIFLTKDHVERSQSIFVDSVKLSPTKFYNGFDDFREVLNKRHKTVANRNLIRTDTKQYVAFSMPTNLFELGYNRVRVSLIFENYSVTADSQIKLNDP